MKCEGKTRIPVQNQKYQTICAAKAQTQTPPQRPNQPNGNGYAEYRLNPAAACREGKWSPSPNNLFLSVPSPYAVL
jgi:hypothetical protein